MKKLSKSSAKKKAWKSFSLFIRKSSANKRGLVVCYTCGKKSHYKNMQTGHWIEGHANAVYINEDYVRPQCVSCNMFKGGMQGEFRDRIRKELGNKIVDQLIRESNDIIKLTTEDYIELDRFYKEQLENL